MTSIIVMTTLHHININCRISHHQRFISSTKDFTDTCKRTNIQSWIIVRRRRTCSIIGSTFTGSPDRIAFCSCILIAINRVWSQITATIEFTNNNWYITSACLLNIHCDGTHQSATISVTTENTGKLSTGDGQADIAANISMLRTCIDFVNLMIWLTAQNNIGSTTHISILSTTINVISK